MRRFLLCLTALLALAACGPLPHPFLHQERNPLIEDRKALSSIVVEPLDAVPGLTVELIKAFEQQDIPATTQSMGKTALRLKLVLYDKGFVSWSLKDIKGGLVGEGKLDMPSGKWTEAAKFDFSRQLAGDISLVLRGQDSGTQDVDNRPMVQLMPMRSPHDFDADGMNYAMSRALLHQGLLVGAKNPVAEVEGLVKITRPPPTLPSDQDILELIWVVRSPDGKELGRVAQGSPVDHMLLIGILGPLARTIAEAGAPGIAEVVRQKAVTKPQ